MAERPAGPSLSLGAEPGPSDDWKIVGHVVGAKGAEAKAAGGDGRRKGRRA